MAWKKKKNAPGEKILVLHAHLGSARSLRLAAIFSPSIFCLGFHRPVQLPKHIFCCYLICKKFFIPLFLFITPGHLSRVLLPDRPNPWLFSPACGQLASMPAVKRSTFPQSFIKPSLSLLGVSGGLHGRAWTASGAASVPPPGRVF